MPHIYDASRNVTWRDECWPFAGRAPVVDWPYIYALCIRIGYLEAYPETTRSNGVTEEHRVLQLARHEATLNEYIYAHARECFPYLHLWNTPAFEPILWREQMETLDRVANLILQDSDHRARREQRSHWYKDQWGYAVCNSLDYPLVQWFDAVPYQQIQVVRFIHQEDAEGFLDVDNVELSIVNLRRSFGNNSIFWG